MANPEFECRKTYCPLKIINAGGDQLTRANLSRNLGEISFDQRIDPRGDTATLTIKCLRCTEGCILEVQVPIESDN